MGNMKDQKLDIASLKEAAGAGDKRIRITCPKCGTVWEEQLGGMSYTCANWTCKYVIRLDDGGGNIQLIDN